jgi:hypothetical protein
VPRCGTGSFRSAIPSTVKRHLPSAGAVAGLALIVAWVLRGLLASAGDRVPGLDAPIHLAWESFTRSALVAGRLPLWDPYVYAGMPHMADLQTQVFYPPALMLRWLPAVLFLRWMVALHLWIGGVGAFVLARTAGVRRAAAFAAAVAFMLGGSAAPWLYHGHFLIICSTAWLPWAFACAMRSVRRGTILPQPALVAVLVLQLLAGYPQGFVYATALVALYFAFSVAWIDPAAPAQSRGRIGMQLVVLVLLVAGIAAFQLVPFLELASQAGRGDGVPYAVAVQDGWALRDLGMVFFPFAGGGSRSEPYRLMLDGVYVGWLLALLVPFAFLDRARRRLAWFCALVVVGAIVFALAGTFPLYRLHYALFPGFRVPGRLLALATLGLVLLGAIGLERFVALAAERRWRAVLASAAIGLIALAAAGVVMRSSPIAAGGRLMHGPTVMPLLLLGGLLATALAAAHGGARAAFALAIVLTTADVTTFAAGGVNAVPVDTASVREWVGAADGGRVWSACGNVVGSTQLLLLHRPTLDGPGGVSLRDYTEWLDLLPAGAADAPVASAAGRALLDSANTSTIVSCAPLSQPGLSLVAERYPTFVYRNEFAWPRAFWTCTVLDLPRREIVDQLRRGATIAGSATRFVNVRWSAATDDSRRRELETRYHLTDGTRREGATWRYVLRDDSAANTRALVGDPSVEDTSGIDRAAGTAIADDEPRLAALEKMASPDECGRRAAVAVVTRDNPDGRIEVDVDAPSSGLLFLSEPYYSERRAFVDGAPATALRANLGFTAVSLAPGRHRVTLRVVPRSFYEGIAITAATALIWFGATRIRRRRRPAVAHV